MTRQARIEHILQDRFSPISLEIVNQSDKHKHHSGDNGTGETHYDVTLSTNMFIGKSRIACHRMVNDVLADEFKTGLHALALNLIIPKTA